MSCGQTVMYDGVNGWMVQWYGKVQVYMQMVLKLKVFGMRILNLQKNANHLVSNQIPVTTKNVRR